MGTKTTPKELAQQVWESANEETVAEQSGEKRPTESSEAVAELVSQPINKRPRVSPSLDLAVQFMIQPKRKGSLVPTGASASKDPSVMLSVALVIAFPADKASFSTKPNVILIAPVAQSTILESCIRLKCLPDLGVKCIILPLLLYVYLHFPFHFCFRRQNGSPKLDVVIMMPWN